VERLVPALVDVRWSAKDVAVLPAVDSLRLWADGSAVVGMLARAVLRRAPKGDGSLTSAVKCWEKSTPRQQEQIVLVAWRRANPAWANNNDHDPYPGAHVPVRR
jgi:hypothetical protein